MIKQTILFRMNIGGNQDTNKLFDFQNIELDFAMKEKPMKINFVNYIKYRKDLIKFI